MVKEQEQKSSKRINLSLKKKKATKAKSQVAMRNKIIIQQVKTQEKELQKVNLFNKAIIKRLNSDRKNKVLNNKSLEASMEIK